MMMVSIALSESAVWGWLKPFGPTEVGWEALAKALEVACVALAQLEGQGLVEGESLGVSYDVKAISAKGPGKFKELQ